MKGRSLSSLSRRSVVPFKFNSKGRHHIPRQRHLVTKWRDFDAALRNRGTSTIWFTEEALADWKAQPRSTFWDALRKPCFCKDGLFDELKKALAERILNAKLDDHFDGEAAAGKANHRNGHSKKSALTETSKIDLTIPRDGEGSFDPKPIARYHPRFPVFEETIESIYARGMTAREIQGHLFEFHELEASPDLISTVTAAVLETVAEWRNWPLETMYPLVFFDTPRVKIRDEGLVRNKAAYVALGVTPEGTKDILDLWIETSEGAEF